MGSSALLLFAIEELSESFQFLGGAKFRTWINLFAGNRASAMVLGVLLSMILCSSGAVTAMLVGLANSQLLTLSQVFSVTLGAGIGTTLVVQLFALPVAQGGLFLIAMGVMAGILASSSKVRYIGKTLVFGGVLFLSMKMILDAGTSLEQNELFQFLRHYFRNRPLASLLLATIFTSLVMSSAATVALTMSVLSAAHGTLEEALPWVLGANLGTTTTAFWASLRSGALGKQAALGNLLCKLFGVCLAFPLQNYFLRATAWLSPDFATQIALLHTGFNVGLAIFMFPFIPLGVRLVQRMLPEGNEEGPFRFYYLDARSLQTPELALAQAQREVLRLSDLVEQMVQKSIQLFESRDLAKIEEIKAMDKIADFLNKGIKLHLTRLSQKEMSPEQVQKEFELLFRTNDLENIGDIVDKSILELVRKNLRKGYWFSSEGWSEILAFHGTVVDCLRVSTAYFNSRDPVLSAKLLVLHQQIEDNLLALTENHVRRLHEGVRESRNTTSVHLDLLGHLQRIANLAINFTRYSGRL